MVKRRYVTLLWILLRPLLFRVPVVVAGCLLLGFFVADVGALCAYTFVTAAQLGIVAPGVLLTTATEPDRKLRYILFQNEKIVYRMINNLKLWVQKAH